MNEPPARPPAGWSTAGEVASLLTHRSTLRRTVITALIVGTVLFAINQLDTVLAGAATAWTWGKVTVTYVVPFTVANVGVLLGTGRSAERRERHRRRPDEGTHMALMTATTGREAHTDASRVYLRALTALRIFTGLVWLSNGTAKLIDKGSYDWGFISFNLVTRASAQFIADDASKKTYLAPLGTFYQKVVLPNWGFFGAFLTLAELAIGLGLVFGMATRLAAVGGLLLIGPIWLMLLHTGGYLWEYPAEDLFPLVLLAIVPAGRVGGLDRRLGLRFGHRWPF